MGVDNDSEKQHAKELMKKTLATYLEQVIKKWQEKSFWQKKIDFPLIILINIADEIGELVTDVVEKLQDRYPFVRLIAVLPLPKNEFVNQLKEEGESNENVIAFENRYNEFKNNDNEKNKKYVWELSEYEMPHIAHQTKLKKWRMFNEFVAQHSHLMIVFWQGEKDNWKDQDDSLTWAVRYKLEGYPGLSRSEQSDFITHPTTLITHPATGPVLHIQTDSETLQQSSDFLPVYLYYDRAIITKEVDQKRQLIISEPKFWDVEQLRKTWLGKKFSDIGSYPEIDKNIKVLKELNYACQDKRIPLNNQSLRSFIEEYVIDKYKNSGKAIEKENIPETDKPTGQLIAHYCLLSKLADFYQKKNDGLIRLFCSIFLMLLVLNATLIFLNDICVMGFGINIFRLSHYYVTQWIPNQNLPIEEYYWEQLVVALKQFAPQAMPDPEMDALIASQGVNISRVIGAFLAFSLAVSLCIITIFYCCVTSFLNSWHYKYHQFKTLTDCLKVQVFWRIASMDNRVSANFRSHQIPAVDWILVALNGLNITIPNSPRIESTKVLKERIRILDTIWIEDIIQKFDKTFRMSDAQSRMNTLSFLQKIIALIIASTIPFLAVFFIADFGFHFSICGKTLGFDGLPFQTSVFWGARVTVIIWLLIIVWLLFKAIQRYVSARIKWAQNCYTGFNGFLGNIYRRIKQQKKTKRYFLISQTEKIFHAAIIIIACFGAFFEIKRLNLIYAAAQCPSVEHLYNPLMAVRLIVQIILAIMAIWWLYNRMFLFTIERRRIEQLYYPFTMADYSIDTLLEDEKAVESINSDMWNKVSSWFGINSDQSSQISKDADDEDKVKLCQQVLLELGQEVLAKRADWLITVTDRLLQSPK
ncbi:MAG: hypothetical protein IKX40_02145 [Thermoguttaceae bacterium]|nr:hypothetical protein [Thermoguttaceae bacterium]